MNDEKPDWRDEKTGEGDGYDRPRSTGGGERRAGDPRFTDTRPPSYGSDSVSASREGARSSSARERLSADYDDEPVFRRRSAGGGLSAVLGSDVMTRRLVYGAAGLGALLVVGVGGWSLLGGHSGGIPVIGPPPGPVRDRPADPGGMQIMSGGADLDVTGKGEAHLAPEPEQPRPEALAARSAPEAPASAAAAKTDGAGSTVPSESSVASDAQPPAPVTPAGETARSDQSAVQSPAVPVKAAPEKPSVATPVPQKPVAAPAPEPAPAAKSAIAGQFMVQLAALGSDADAKATWSKLSKQASDLLSDREPTIEQKTINGHVFYRLRLGGFETSQAARAFCVRLHARSIACTPAVF